MVVMSENLQNAFYQISGGAWSDLTFFEGDDQHAVVTETCMSCMSMGEWDEEYAELQRLLEEFDYDVVFQEAKKHIGS